MSSGSGFSRVCRPLCWPRERVGSNEGNNELNGNSRMILALIRSATMRRTISRATSRGMR